jgi:dihydrofolate reductase
MSKVFTGASMSLDGYISGPNETGFEHLFKWMENGDVEVPTANPELTFRLSEEDASHVRALTEQTGAFVVGRKLFDVTSGWGGRHPLDRPVVVLTHDLPAGWEREGENFTFVSDGIESAVERARALAGGKAVGVNGGTIASQCLDARVLDEIWVELVPVLLGGGTPFFDRLANAPVELEGPLSMEAGNDVTHLRYRVRYTD